MTDGREELFTVVAVGAHPDDLEIVCGGTLAKLVRQGHRVAIIDLTSGEPTPRGTLEQRAREAEDARKVLGVPLRLNLDLPNRVLMDDPANRFALATVLRRLRPSILLSIAGRTPSGSPDHHQAHLLIEAARFYSQLTKWDDRFDNTPAHLIPHLVYAPFPFDAEQRNWHGSFVIDITDTFEQKLAAVRCYESQFDATRFEKIRHMLTCNAGAVGGRCGFSFGEQFTLPVPVGGQDLAAIVQGSKVSQTRVVLPGKQASL